MTSEKRVKETVHLGETTFQENLALNVLFEREVANEKIAWYIDYFTEDAERFSVRYIAKKGESVVKMTNENKFDRDAADPEGTQWGPEDVTEWFKVDGKENRWLFLFTHNSGELFGIHCEPNRVFAFGPSSLSLPMSNLWDEYVEDGIRGPMRACSAIELSKLQAISVNPDVFGHLAKVDLVHDYMCALAVILDA
jgi:hypothetical protein